MMTIFEHIKKQRKTLGLKTKVLAQELGIDQALISKYENGKRLPTKEQVVKLAALLQLDVEEMLVLYTKELLLKYLPYDDISVQALRLVQEEFAEYQKASKPSYKKSIQNVLIQIDKLKAKIDKIRHLDSFRIAQAFELEYTFESNRIEGNTLTLQETDLVINEGLTISGKTMREHLEAINHKDAIVFVKSIVQNSQAISESVILQIHNLILRGIQAEYAGKYRNVQVMIKGSKHLPPQAFLVSKQMEDLMYWFEMNKNLLHPVILAAEMHVKLVTIHPFIDGNGRTSRLLMNLILMKNGYSIANIKGDSASKMVYFSSLEEAQTSQKSDTFIELVARTTLESLEKYAHVLGVSKA